MDVDKKAIAYLSTQLTKADVRIVGTEPPLPFDDESFDVIFSVSLWTHLRPELVEPYLQETKRLLKPGGVALITTRGYAAMDHKRDKVVAWDNSITPEDLRASGTFYFPTPKGASGNSAHSPEHIQQNWTRVFPDIKTVEAVIGLHKVQDLNIMRK